MAHPSGIVVRPWNCALRILPNATVVVAMSSSHESAPGTDMQMGLVPNRWSLPCQGATNGDALHITIPIIPAAEIRCAQ